MIFVSSRAEIVADSATVFDYLLDDVHNVKREKEYLETY